MRSLRETQSSAEIEKKEKYLLAFHEKCCLPVIILRSWHSYPACLQPLVIYF